MPVQEHLRVGGIRGIRKQTTRSDMEVTVVSLSSSPRHPERSCSHPGTLAA